MYNFCRKLLTNIGYSFHKTNIFPKKVKIFLKKTALWHVFILYKGYF